MGEVARVALPVFSKWTFMITELYGRCDVLDVNDILASSLCDGIADAIGELPESDRDVVLVGMLMTKRDNFDCVSDEDIVAACHQMDSESKVMQKFLEFLQESS